MAKKKWVKPKVKTLSVSKTESGSGGLFESLGSGTPMS